MLPEGRTARITLLGVAMAGLTAMVRQHARYLDARRGPVKAEKPREEVPGALPLLACFRLQIPPISSSALRVAFGGGARIEAQQVPRWGESHQDPDR